jgi:lactoylglutathione lyase
MQLGYIIVYVPDVPATLDFYERAFGLERRFLHESNTYGEMETGGTALAFAAESLVALNGIAARPNRRSDPPAAAEVGLVTDDVAAAYRKAVSAGALAYQEPTEKPWGQTVGYVRDINGFLVEICSPMGA